MVAEYEKILKEKLDSINLSKLQALNNFDLNEFIAKFIKLCNPDSVFVRSDEQKDIDYLRQRALDLGEEIPLKQKGHTIHFDGLKDQARDKDNTKCLLPQEDLKYCYTECLEQKQGVSEVTAVLENIMQGKQMYVCFFCLGPVNSDFSLVAVQITDSAYVAHSEDILYRPGYEAMKKVKSNDFFKFVHSAGELENYVSQNIKQRRVYMDLVNDVVYSVNTQYAGNSVGLKKLSLRLAIQKATREGWLAEHMFVMGVYNQNQEKAYFCGAYPSMCGKTSTAMVSGETIVGDDIAYLRVKDNKVYAVNVERGIFGIIEDVNSKDDALLLEALSNNGEVIFSNVLMDKDGVPFWKGKDAKLPKKGINYAGEWFPGKTDHQGNEFSVSHKNARYTIQLSALKNVDEKLEDANGVEVKGVIYGGRDSDTSVPVEQSFSWRHGIIMKAASLESETTAATLGQEGIRVFNPMSNVDFLSVPLAKYIESNLSFGEKVKTPPLIFSVNYFLRSKNSSFLNSKEDKRVWLKWMRERVDEKVRVRIAPTGLIPCYADLKKLFDKILHKNYSDQDYVTQFTIRIPENLAKIERIRNIYKEVGNIGKEVFDQLSDQEERLKSFLSLYGEYISPFELEQK